MTPEALTPEALASRLALARVLAADSSIALGGAFHLYPDDVAALAAGTASEYLVGKARAEVPAAIVARCLVAPAAPRSRCRGDGWVSGLSWDTEYPCGGCAKCRPEGARLGHAVSAFVWSAATLAERERLAATVLGMQCLAAIGAAVRAALGPGAGVGALVAWSASAWSEVRKGRWYRITATRGNAAPHRGKVGRVAWVGESTYGRGSRTSLRAGLVLAAEHHHEGLVYVGAASLEPVPEPADARAERLASEARKAERASYKAFDGARGSVAYVIDGEHKGKRGAVVWVGESRGFGGRLVGLATGVTSLPRGRYRGEVLWLDARDVAADIPAEVGSELGIEVECYLAAIARILGLALADVPESDRVLGMLDLRPGAARATRKRRRAA